MKNKEIWKSISGYEGLYEVSNYGKIRSLNRVLNRKDGVKTSIKGKILTYNICRKGYYRSKLCKGDGGKYKTIHRLVAIEFIPNPKKLPQINHIDGDKSNNNVENLEWCTNKYNMEHAIENGLTRFNNTSKPVSQYTMEGVLIKTYPSGLQAERETGIYTSGISMCCRGYYTHSKGYIWRYADEK